MDEQQFIRAEYTEGNKRDSVYSDVSPEASARLGRQEPDTANREDRLCLT
jgi:hypothetical protein